MIPLLQRSLNSFYHEDGLTDRGGARSAGDVTPLSVNYVDPALESSLYLEVGLIDSHGKKLTHKQRMCNDVELRGTPLSISREARSARGHVKGTFHMPHGWGDYHPFWTAVVYSPDSEADAYHCGTTRLRA